MSDMKIATNAKTIDFLVKVCILLSCVKFALNLFSKC